MPKTRPELEQEWLQVFGTELPKHIHSSYANKYLEWHKNNGSFDKSLQRQIDKLVESYEKGIDASQVIANAKIEIKSGTKLIREYRGKKYEVIKLDSGFEYNGKTYRSLSAIANEITGTKWNGKKFFGV
jgi:hypothetical protein